MAFDLGIDKNLFLDTTCRTCSRFFSEDVKFYKIFEEKLKAATTNEGGGGAVVDGNGMQTVGDLKDSKVYETCEEIRDILEDLNIWKLNIKPFDGLPQQLCEECFQRFKQVKAFREECLDSQRVLQSYFLDFENLLEVGKLSPAADLVKLELDTKEDLVLGKDSARSSPKCCTQDVMSPFSSPRLRLSPRFVELGNCLDTSSSMGTPPPLFEEIKTEPIDMETMEVMKAESELPYQEPLKKEYTIRSPNNSSDEESSTPTTDEDEETEDSSSSDEESLQDFKFKQQKKKMHSYLKCKICGQSCQNRQQLKMHHMRFHPQEKPFECDICTSTFKSSFLLAQHKLKHNRPDTMQCEECKKYFRSQLHLQRHFKNFHLKSTYTCHICHQQFENYTQMRFQYHVRQHGEKRFSCSYCDKAFHQKIHLINHERTHTKEQPFRCDLCGKAYRQQTACQEHMKTHKDPTPFKCKHCSKEFSQRSTLRIHMQKVHNLEKQSSNAAQNFGRNSGNTPGALFEQHNFMGF
ncbi:zinc finger protein 383-like [Lucilia cuprina]|uniref:zinc finger protein 383-like n=1 Tax=Lucilia cuprina TaxID=7375 RepID=UPI001F059AAE|nr:zinc finger protein 383-like [Lucilia cuprina]